MCNKNQNNKNQNNKTFLLALSFLQYSNIITFWKPYFFDSNFFNLNEDQVNTLLYGSQKNDSKCANQEILKFVIAYIKATTRFGRSLISNQ